MTANSVSAAAVARQALTGTLDYLSSLPHRPVTSDGAIERADALLDCDWPAQPSNPLDTVELLRQAGEEAAVASAGGRFYGLVTGGLLPAAVGARILGAGWDQLAATDQTSPLAHSAERVAGRWVLEALGLPPHSSVGFVSGASMASLHGLAVARNVLLARQGWDLAEQGLFGAPPLRVVAPEEIHSAVLKMLTILGFGSRDIEWIPCDAQGRAIVDRMPELDAHTIVLLQAGNVNSGAFDPIAEIAARAKAKGAWVHIDGAFGMWAAASPTLRHLVAGAELADSWAVDGHKWLNVPYDCGMAICAHPEEVARLMGNEASYLTSGNGRSAKDMVLELSRPGRAIESWAALHSLGQSGLAELVERCCRHACSFARGLEALGFTVLHDVVLNVVTATIADREHEMERLAAMVRSSGECWFGTTRWQDRTAIRLCVSSWMTTEEDVERSLAAIAHALGEV